MLKLVIDSSDFQGIFASFKINNKPYFSDFSRHFNSYLKFTTRLIICKIFKSKFKRAVALDRITILDHTVLFVYHLYLRAPSGELKIFWHFPRHAN